MNQGITQALAREFEILTGIQCNGVYMPNGASHRQSTLRSGEQGVYVFLQGFTCLKVGKAGPNSTARWNSNHYYFAVSQPSRLANSLINESEKLKSALPQYDPTVLALLNRGNTRDWMMTNLSRIEFKITSEASIGALNLLEGIVQYRLNPVFEG